MLLFLILEEGDITDNKDELKGRPNKEDIHIEWELTIVSIWFVAEGGGHWSIDRGESEGEDACPLIVEL